MVRVGVGVRGRGRVRGRRRVRGRVGRRGRVRGRDRGRARVREAQVAVSPGSGGFVEGRGGLCLLLG